MYNLKNRFYTDTAEKTDVGKRLVTDTNKVGKRLVTEINNVGKRLVTETNINQ